MRTLAITSGKGGVGKTNISANLAIALSAQGQRVVVFDGDIGLANLDVVLGVRAEGTLQEVVSGDKTLDQVVQDGPGGIRFIPGGSGAETLFAMTEEQSTRFLDEFSVLESNTDILIFDTGAGLDGNVMSFLKAADEVLIVITPDPSSLTDGYAAAKALFKDNPLCKVRLILNMVESEQEARAVFERLNQVANQFLGASFTYAGGVRSDKIALTCIRQRKPFFIAEPSCPASRDVAKIASTLLGIEVVAGETDLASRLKSLFSFGAKKSA